MDAYRAHRRAAARRRSPSPELGVTLGRRARLAGLAALGRISPAARRSDARAARRRSSTPTRFDVVHFHNVSLVGGPGRPRYGDGVKLYTTHEHWLVCPMHVLWRYNREPCERAAVPALQLRVPPAAAALALHGPPRAVARRTSTSSSRRAGSTIDAAPRARASAPDAAAAVLPARRGAASRRRAARAAAERPYFLFVGPAREAEGRADLIEAFRRYDARRPADRGRRASMREELRRQARGLDHVRFLGRVHADELRALYARRGAPARSVGSCYETSASSRWSRSRSGRP